jgi:hypothetical protein
LKNQEHGDIIKLPMVIAGAGFMPAVFQKLAKTRTHKGCGYKNF